MSKDNAKKFGIVAYVILFAVGFLMAYGVCNAHEYSKQVDIATKMKILSDAFLLPAVLYGGLGILVFLGNAGTFGAMAYGVRSLISACRRNPEARKQFKKNYGETYYDYTVQLAKNKAPFTFLLLEGIVFLIISLVFYGLFYKYFVG